MESNYADFILDGYLRNFEARLVAINTTEMDSNWGILWNAFRAKRTGTLVKIWQGPGRRGYRIMTDIIRIRDGLRDRRGKLVNPLCEA